ncbi:putative quinol monooxygenase [Paraburkholderia flava]|uniref:putative quinol monooxygenase n=1 Tax=Paraburkholderia flava TaxID=2547393 RepID=UPI00105DC359|nr:putative quinol monooxygenase [Paraburkholderia flava]
MAEVAVVAISVAKPGDEEKLRVAIEGIVEPTRKERGALQYDLHRDVREPRRFVFFERWESEEALAAHAKSAHIEAYKKAIVDWVEHAEIRVLTRIK